MKKQRMNNRSFRKIWVPVVAVSVGVCILGTITMNMLSDIMNDYLGRGEKIETSAGEEVSYYDKYTDDRKVSTERSYETALEVSREGMVLLKNNGILPLAKNSKVTPFGYRYISPIYGQIGGGSAKWVISPVTPKQGMSEHLTVDTSTEKCMSGTPKALKEAAGTLSAGDVAGSLMGGDSKIYEFSPDVYDGITVSGDVGIVFIAREGQEGSDKKYDGYEDGTPHYCALTQNELGTIKRAKQLCGKVIVCVEASTPIEYAPLMEKGSEYEADAILLVGHQGERGFSTLGEVLTGKVNPSGKTVDVIPTDFTKDPTYMNFGEFSYSNVSTKPYYIEYQEDVYMGYRYYETADVMDEAFVYGSLDRKGGILEKGAVCYPFGYGLSYTTFEQSITSFQVKDGVVDVKVSVTNTGDTEGKDVIQLYYSAPYTQFDIANHIEKPVTQLIAFEKTASLKPNETKEYSLSFSVEDMASYCVSHDNGNGTKGCYVLEAGEYTISLKTNSHETIEEKTYQLSETKFFDGSDNEHIRQSEKDAQSGMNADGTLTGQPQDKNATFIAATNLFEDCTTYMAEESSILTRSDWTSSFPEKKDRKSKVLSEKVKATFDLETTFAPATDQELGNLSTSKVYSDSMPVYGEQNGLVLSDMRGKDFYDESWEDYLDQIDFDGEKSNIVKLLTAANYSTYQVDSIGLTATIECDGANGIKRVKTDPGMTMSATYGYAPLMAQTWNKDLLYEVGCQFGQEALTLGVTGWYSPAINLHRSPFSGRNFEYYSEDPVLTGELAAKIVSGAGDNGLVCYIKHFAVNDQETRRAEYLHTWATEQAMRELYLKAFELPIKEARMTIKYTDGDGRLASKTMKAATALMCAQNDIGSVICHGNYALVTELLRGEWGFNGIVLTDMYSEVYKAHKDLTLRAGVDCFLGAEVLSGFTDYDSATAKTLMRNSIKHIAYAFSNSGLMINSAPGSTAKYGMAPWQVALIVVNVVVYTFAACVIILMILRDRDEKKHPENYTSTPKKE